MNRIVGTLSIAFGILMMVVCNPSFALEATPSDILAAKAQADTLLKRGQIDEAIPLYEEVIGRDKRFANAHYNLATAYYLQGNVIRAADALETFLTLRPRDGEALYNLGCLKLRQGNFFAAERYFQDAKACSSLDFLNQKIKEALDFLKGLRQSNLG